MSSKLKLFLEKQKELDPFKIPDVLSNRDTLIRTLEALVQALEIIKVESDPSVLDPKQRLLEMKGVADDILNLDPEKEEV